VRFCKIILISGGFRNFECGEGEDNVSSSSSFFSQKHIINYTRIRRERATCWKNT